MKFLFGLVTGAVVAVGILVALFYLKVSETRMSDLQITGFRLSDQSILLFIAKYRSDTLTPKPFAVALVLDRGFNLIGKTEIPDPIIKANEFLIESDSQRMNVQIQNPSESVAVRWDNQSRVFKTYTNSLPPPFEKSVLILRSTK